MEKLTTKQEMILQIIKNGLRHTVIPQQSENW